jgi:hypothetical protein
MTRTLLRAALLGAALLWLPAAARAQFRVPVGGYNVTSDSTQLLVRPTVVGSPALAYNPYLYGYPGYGYGYYPYGINPFGGGLDGVANLTTANAQYLLTVQEARRTSEQVNQARIDTRRRLFDELRYEQMNTPTSEELRDRDILLRIQRSRNSPPRGEVWSGQSLNDLLTAINRNETANGVQGPTVPVDEATLRRINVTDGTTRGSGGMFRNDGRIRWPLVLGDARFDADREKIDMLAAEAVKQIKAYGNADVKTLRDLTEAVRALQARIDDNVRALTPSDSIRASRFARELNDGVKTLGGESAANFFNGKWQLQGGTVAEVVTFMNRNGLKFAPATDGDEAAYNAFFQDLLSYDAGLSRIVGAATATPPPPRVP